MSGAGLYNTRFRRLIYTETVEATLKEREVTYVEGETYWGKIEPLKGYEKLFAGVINSQVTGTIKLRNIVDVTTDDRLKDIATGDVYILTGRIFGDNETIFQALNVDQLPV